MTNSRPTVLLAHMAGLELFSDADVEQIGTTGRLLNREPLASWDDPRADALLAYAAGTVKETVAAEVFDRGVRDDEWYGFDENPRPRVHVLATVDEHTYEPFSGAMGPDHPIVWSREFDGGRTAYNAMGHRAATWRDDGFLASVLGGIELAAGVLPMATGALEVR